MSEVPTHIHAEADVNLVPDSQQVSSTTILGRHSSAPLARWVGPQPFGKLSVICAFGVCNAASAGNDLRSTL